MGGYLRQGLREHGFAVDLGGRRRPGPRLRRHRGLRPADPRPDAPGPRRPRPAPPAPGAGGGDAGHLPDGPRRRRRPGRGARRRRRRLPGQAVLVRRAAGPDPGRAPARGGEAAPPVLQVADLRLDPAARVVERAGRRIDLSAKQFALLALPDAARRPGGQPDDDPGARLGLRVRRPDQRRRRPHQPAAEQGRPRASTGR